MAAAPEGVTGARLTGAAGPREAPPARRNKPASSSTTRARELARDAGVPEALADSALMQRLRVLVMSAAQAMREGRRLDAVRQQRAACDVCLHAELPREALVMQLVLGGYVLQAGSPERAVEIVRDARRAAEARGLLDLATQAELAAGAGLLAMNRPDEAATAYAEAGQLGTTAGAPVLAIEGYRMAGQLMISRGRPELAGKAWLRAIEAAEKAAPSERRSSSAPDAARALAALCRKHKLVLQAESLEVQAAALEMEATPAVGAEGIT
jgi:tetratricopeptide (TPR) repeat protein